MITAMPKSEIIRLLDRLAGNSGSYRRFPGEAELRDVVLYLQTEAGVMQVGDNFLPVQVADGEQGYFPFSPWNEAAIAAYFGPDPVEAQRLVGQINFDRGFPPNRVREIVIQSFQQ